MPVSGPDYELNLRAGELVEVRSKEEILSTLDPKGRLEALPFMPEMLDFCGKRFQVYKRADKTCDTIDNLGGRRMFRTVHLGDLRCDGSSHGGCQARCLLFWKEAWLKRVDSDSSPSTSNKTGESFDSGSQPVPAKEGLVTIETLMQSTLVSSVDSSPEGVVYSCQATEHLKASTPLPWWDFRQYLRDMWTGNVSIFEMLRAIVFWIFSKTLKLGAYRAQITVYNRIQKKRGGCPYPFREGSLTKTPSEELNLQPGELVQVKSHDEVLATLDRRNRNRGLSFDVEMVSYCGGQYKVIQRVEDIIHEKTGKMIRLPGVCVMLEGVTCRAEYSRNRVFCRRAIHSFWREIWLRRVE